MENMGSPSGRKVRVGDNDLFSLLFQNRNTAESGTPLDAPHRRKVFLIVLYYGGPAQNDDIRLVQLILSYEEAVIC